VEGPSTLAKVLAARFTLPVAQAAAKRARLPVGEHKNRKTKNQRFLADHPLCCFCGGGSEATTVDHVPSRAFFVNRDWPEGYEFPSCAACQGASRVAELACAAVMRSASTTTDSDVNEIAELYRGLSRNDPATYREFLGTERSSGLVLPAAVQRRLYSPEGLPEFNLGPRINAHIGEYIIKLTKALYYMHFNAIVPASAAIEFITASNAEIGKPLERQIDAMRFPGTATLVRCSNNRAKAPISDQFQYSYIGSEVTRDSVFKIRLHQALIGATTVIHDPASVPIGSGPR
jgi:hypothetical protein